MKKTTLKLNALTIIQLEAGEHQAVVENGNVYVQVQSVADLGSTEAKSETAPSIKEDSAKETKSTNKSSKYTEKELMDMETSDLLDLCEEFGIDPNKFEGKNTNKKLRGLILDYQAGKLEQSDDEEEEETAEVVDDTKPVSTGRARRGASPLKKTPTVIDNWDSLKEGDLISVKLDTEGEDADKLWEAEVLGWDIPKGMDEEYLFVKFLEDNQEDYLRDGDVIYEYQKDL